MRRLLSLLLFVLSAAVVEAQTVIDATLTTSGVSCSATVVRLSVEGTETPNCVLVNMRNSPSIGVHVIFSGTGSVSFSAGNGGPYLFITDDIIGVSTITSSALLLFTNPGYSQIVVHATANSGTILVKVSRGGTGLKSTATLSGGSVSVDTTALATHALQTAGNSYLSTMAASAATISGVPLIRVGVFNASGTQVSSFGGGAGGALTSDPDDGSIAAGQTNDNANVLQHYWNGTAWLRDARGTAGTPIGGVQSVQGVAGGTALPVSGAFFQATQPISVATIPSHPVTNAGTFAVQVTSAPTTAVTGTFFQTTQPISGSITCSNCSGTGVSVNEDVAFVNDAPGTPAYAKRTASPANTSSTDGDWEPLQVNDGRLWVDASGPTLTVGTHAVTGTFFQATQPVSLVSLPALATGSNVIGAVTQSSTWTMQPGNTANTTPWLTSLRDGSNTAVTDDTSHAIKVLSVSSSGGTLIPTIECGSSVAINISTSGSTQLVAASGAQIGYICGYNWMAGGTTTTQLVRGTGTNCGTGQVILTGAYPTTAQTGVSYGNGSGIISSTAAGDAICFVNGSAVQVSGILTYTRF